MSSGCVFCAMLSGDIPAEIVAENKWFFAVKDINPLYSIHYLIIAKEHIPTVSDISEDRLEHFAYAWELAQQLARLTGVTESGFRLTVNNGPDAGQEVPHFHMHFLGGEPLKAL